MPFRSRVSKYAIISNIGRRKKRWFVRPFPFHMELLHNYIHDTHTSNNVNLDLKDYIYRNHFCQCSQHPNKTPQKIEYILFLLLFPNINQTPHFSLCRRTPQPRPARLRPSPRHQSLWHDVYSQQFPPRRPCGER